MAKKELKPTPVLKYGLYKHFGGGHLEEMELFFDSTDAAVDYIQENQDDEDADFGMDRILILPCIKWEWR